MMRHAVVASTAVNIHRDAALVFLTSLSPKKGEIDAMPPLSGKLKA